MKADMIKRTDAFPGCELIVELGEKHGTEKIRLLQITDMQFIDSAQRRTPERLREDEIVAWVPENFMAQCGNHIASLIAQTKPDLIFITGDIVYGEFDDNGTTMKWFCEFMDSFGIPWAPVFGNHDNESKMGVDWQCEQFEKSEYCVFERGKVSGNGNYTIGLVQNGELIRAMHMIDSHGCISRAGIYPDQLELINESTLKLQKSHGHPIPAFIAFHIPTDTFTLAETSKGYKNDSRKLYTIGLDAPQLDDDFGFCYEAYNPIKTECDFLEFLHENNIDGVFVGHCHKISTCIRYDGVRFVYGLKTGQYDYHLTGNIGGTLITLEDESFTVQHIPSLTQFSKVIPNKN